jgi:hypothetical protein
VHPKHVRLGAQADMRDDSGMNLRLG